MGNFVLKYEVRMRNQFGQFLAEADAGEEAAVADTLAEFEDVARAYAPKRTGELAGSITAVQFGKSGTIFTESDHAGPQEFGAGPHDIPGAFGIPEGVHHPGNPATHFLRRAADVMKDKFVRNVIARFPG